MPLKYNLIGVVSENMGIAKDGKLPFSLPREYKFYMSITRETSDKSKKNVVIMGRKSWDCLGDHEKPMPGRINFVLTSNKDLDLSQFPDTYVLNSWAEVESKLVDAHFKEKYETIWVVGGNRIYDEAQKSKYFYRAYISKVRKYFDCDAFFPELVKNIKRVTDPRTPQGVQKENGLEWEVEVWENTNC
ncbi:dihydrofolate reductase-like [Coccinella septempunctata]|uniref:dihydrofolate reductase-like n=1 Tax=Coccinella septempunctata TaxID=41139 RepID=UPI001D08399D|nr:dihydrofolate reductase-like [Coccinella septempunctata]